MKKAILAVACAALSTVAFAQNKPAPTCPSLEEIQNASINGIVSYQDFGYIHKDIIRDGYEWEFVIGSHEHSFGTLEQTYAALLEQMKYLSGNPAVEDTGYDSYYCKYEIPAPLEAWAYID